MVNGQPIQYYEYIERECEALCQLLNINWSSENSPLRKRIHANKSETKDLILLYYDRLSDLTIHAPVKEGVPRVCIKAGLVELDEHTIKLVIQTIGAYDIPILDRISHSSDPYLRIELYPRFLFPFPDFHPLTTETRKKTLNPKWNNLFDIEIPADLFFTSGSCLCLSVLDYDQLSYNDLAGQAVIPLSMIQKMPNTSPKNLPPPMILPLALPLTAQYTDIFKILEARSAWDDIAQYVIYYEKYIRDYRILPPAAMDDNDCGGIQNRLSLARNRQRIKYVIKSFIKK